MAMFEAFLVQDLVLTQGLSEQGVSHCDERLRAMCWVFWRCGTHRPEGARIWGRVAFPPLYRTSSFGPPSILPEHRLLWLWHHSWRDQPGEDTESSSSNVMAKPSEGELEMEGTLRGNYSLQTGLGATGKTPLWELSEAPGADHCQGARSPCKQVSKNQAFWLCLLTRLHSLAWTGKADDIGAIL